MPNNLEIARDSQVLEVPISVCDLFTESFNQLPQKASTGAVLISSPSYDREVAGNILLRAQELNLPIIYKHTPFEDDESPYKSYDQDLRQTVKDIEGVQGIVVDPYRYSDDSDGHLKRIVAEIRVAGFTPVINADQWDRVFAKQPLKAIEEGLEFGVTNFMYTPVNLGRFVRFLVNIDAPKNCRFFLNPNIRTNNEVKPMPEAHTLNFQYGFDWHFLSEANIPRSLYRGLISKRPSF